MQKVYNIVSNLENLNTKLQKSSKHFFTLSNPSVKVVAAHTHNYVTTTNMIPQFLNEQSRPPIIN